MGKFFGLVFLFLNLYMVFFHGSLINVLGAAASLYILATLD